MISVIQLKKAEKLITYPISFGSLGSVCCGEESDERWRDLAERFAVTFPEQECVCLFSAPGRVELSGNHTDHQNGRVLCAAVDADIIALATPIGDAVVELHSVGYDRPVLIKLNELQPRSDEQRHSVALIKGVLAYLREHDYRIGGFVAYCSSRVPPGSGLSSSAAFESLIGSIVNSLYNNNTIPPLALALAGQYAENKYFGKPSGLMDQMAACFGGLLAIDFVDPKQPKTENIDLSTLSFADHVLAITHTPVSHRNLTDEYAAIPQEMALVAKELNGKRLGNIPEERFYRHMPDLIQRLPARATLRALHFYRENARVREQVESLKEGKIKRFFELVRESGLSSWTLLQNVSTADGKSDQKYALALATAEAFLRDSGVTRVHGGGFGGTIQSWVPTEKIDAFKKYMDRYCGENSTHVYSFRPYGATELSLNLQE
ncbi:MAG: galactokinase [Clostridiaceae bacterium]|nr:galactokinase [Clostridiaceae bacterium]